MYEPPRQPNGEFAPFKRSEAEVSLDPIAAPADDATYNADGTFEFPPPARSYDQLVAFWMNCRVPDTVIRQMQIGYVQYAYETSVAHYQAWIADNDPPAMHLKSRRGRPEELNPEYERWSAAYQELQARYEDAHPIDIDPTIARDLARVHRMRWQARRSEEWLPGITQAVEETRIEIAGADPDGVPIGALLDAYRVDQLDDAVWRDQTAEHVIFIAEKLDQLVRQTEPEDPAQP